MERELGMPIAEAFERDGEEAFRAREAEVVGELLEEADGGAIALGGGSVLSERVREALGRHVVVWLQVDAEEAWRRIEGTDRPLATQRRGRGRSCWRSGCRSTRQLADAVVPQGDRGVVARALPSIRALAELPAGTKLLWAASALGRVPGAASGRGCSAPAGGRCEGRRFCVTDTAVGALYARPDRAARGADRGRARRERRRRWPRRSGCCASWPAPG